MEIKAGPDRPGLVEETTMKIKSKVKAGASVPYEY
jgi:hypothetical protein